MRSGRQPSQGRGSLDAGAACYTPPLAGSAVLGRSASLPTPYDVAELLARISLLAPPAPPPHAVEADGSRLHWVQPSGACGLWAGLQGMGLVRSTAQH